MSKISRRGFVKTTALAPLAVTPFSIGQQASREDRFDIVVAGAGHNSMIAAAYWRRPVIAAFSWRGGRSSAAA